MVGFEPGTIEFILTYLSIYYLPNICALINYAIDYTPKF